MSFGTKHWSHWDTKDQIQTLCMDRETSKGRMDLLYQSESDAVWERCCAQENEICSLLFTCVPSLLFLPWASWTFPPHGSLVSHSVSFYLYHFYPCFVSIPPLLSSLLISTCYLSFLTCSVSVSALPSFPHGTLAQNSCHLPQFLRVSPWSYFDFFPSLSFCLIFSSLSFLLAIFKLHGLFIPTTSTPLSSYILCCKIFLETSIRQPWYNSSSWGNRKRQLENNLPSSMLRIQYKELCSRLRSTAPFCRALKNWYVQTLLHHMVLSRKRN